MNITEQNQNNSRSLRKALPKAKVIKGTVEHRKALGGNGEPAGGNNNAALQQILGAIGSNKQGLKQIFDAIGGKEGLEQVINAVKGASGK
jgi:hypothetical protein